MLEVALCGGGRETLHIGVELLGCSLCKFGIVSTNLGHQFGVEITIDELPGHGARSRVCHGTQNRGWVFVIAPDLVFSRHHGIVKGVREIELGKSNVHFLIGDSKFRAKSP